MDAERLVDLARGYELNRLAAEERGDVLAAVSFATVAIVLYELASLECGDEVEQREAA